MTWTLQYSGVKRELAQRREGSMLQFEGNKEGKAEADIINTVVDSFVKSKAIPENSVVGVNAVRHSNGLAINITLDQQTVVATPPVPTESSSKPLTKSAEKAKQAANIGKTNKSPRQASKSTAKKSTAKKATSRK